MRNSVWEREKEWKKNVFCSKSLGRQDVATKELSNDGILHLKYKQEKNSSKYFNVRKKI